MQLSSSGKSNTARIARGGDNLGEREGEITLGQVEKQDHLSFLGIVI